MSAPVPVSAVSRPAAALAAALAVVAWLVAAPALAVVDPPVPRQEPPVNMTEPVYRRLERVHELMGEDRLDAAAEGVAQLEGMRLNDYERALVYQTRGHLELRRDNTAAAIEWLERCVEADALPNVAQLETLYTLAGLYVGEGEYARAVATLERWFRHAERRPAEAYALMGSSHAQLGDWAEAARWVTEAVARAERPRESWYGLLLAAQLELDRYEDAAALLERMVAQWPDRARYWEALSSVQLELDRDEDALATLMLAHRKGLVTEPDRVLNLVRLNLYLDLPWEAGRVLSAALEDGSLAPERAHLDLLLSAWTAAREHERAIAVLDELAELTGEGRYRLQQARLLSERADFAGVLSAAERALEAGDLSEGDAGQAGILLGMAAAELGDLDRAGRAFRDARRHGGELRRTADAWLQWLAERRDLVAAAEGQ